MGFISIIYFYMQKIFNIIFFFWFFSHKSHYSICLHKIVFRFGSTCILHIYITQKHNFRKEVYNHFCTKNQYFQFEMNKMKRFQTRVDIFCRLYIKRYKSASNHFSIDNNLDDGYKFDSYRLNNNFYLHFNYKLEILMKIHF